MTDWSTFWSNFDWSSFWTNILSEIVFFFLGILVSVLIIPRLTIQFLTKRGKKFLLKKISFIIRDLCEFINDMPEEFRTSKDTVRIFSNKKEEFVVLLRPNLFERAAKEILNYKIARSLADRQPEDSFRILKSEIERLMKLKKSLENMIGVHSLNFDDKVIMDVSDLCFEIRRFEYSIDNNYLYDELKVERGGVFGISELNKIYERIIDIIKDLVSGKDYLIEKAN